MLNTNSYDLIISGAGMVGASLACALKNTELKIALIEAKQKDYGKHPGFDARAIALSDGSLDLLEKIALKKSIQQCSTKIKSIHISDKAHCGLVKLSHQELQRPQLGSVIELQDAGRIFHQELLSAHNIDFYCPNSITELKQNAEYIQIKLNNTQQLKAQLLVSAEGAHSHIKKLLNIDNRHFNYHQAAIIANVESEVTHQNLAYERFTNSGPVALLPLSQNRWSLVWSIKEDEISEFQTLSEGAFLRRLQQHFGQRVGRFTKAGARDIYPLKLIQAKDSISHRVVLIGNAAQQLHPIAGQGYNLGLRDAMNLAQQLKQAKQQQQDLGAFSLLKAYEQQRKADRQTNIDFTSHLACLFANKHPLLCASRNFSLLTLQQCPYLKNKLAWKMMGK